MLFDFLIAPGPCGITATKWDFDSCDISQTCRHLSIVLEGSLIIDDEIVSMQEKFSYRYQKLVNSSPLFQKSGCYSNPYSTQDLVVFKGC